MIRYLLLSTIIVVGIATIVAGWMNRDLIKIKSASVYQRVPPKAVQPSRLEAASRPGLRGDAPWALSALPECFTQLSETTGPPAYVLAHLPPGSQPVPAPATFRSADCTISYRDGEAFVTRGDDKLRIPPKIRFYRTPDTLSLLNVAPQGMRLRVYQPVTQ